MTPLRTLPLLLAAALLASGCLKGAPDVAEGHKPQAAPPAVKVTTAQVQIEKMPRYLTLTGSVLADRQSEVAANVAGRIVATYVERGQLVKMGQPLALIDSKASMFSAAAASSNYKAAQTQVTLAQSECARVEELYRQGATTKAEYDRQKAQCEGQLYSASAAQANADLAAKMAGDAVIRAPFDGAVGERYVNVGEYVAPSSKVASIYVVSPARVQISVPEAETARIALEQKLDVEVAAWPERKFPAVVKYISPALRTATRDLIIEAVAENADGALKPGMFASALLLVGEEDLPTVPKEAITEEGPVKRLFLAKDHQAVEMVVRVGGAKEGRVAVLEPLTAQSAVILKPPPGLHDGSSIE